MLEKEIHSSSDALAFLEEVWTSKGVSMSELESKAGISIGMFTRWKNQKDIPAVTKLLRLLDAFDVTLTFKVANTEEESTHSSFLKAVNSLLSSTAWLLKSNNVKEKDIIEAEFLQTVSKLLSSITRFYKSSNAEEETEILQIVSNILASIVESSSAKKEVEALQADIEILQTVNKLLFSATSISEKKHVVNLLNSVIQFTKN